ncbi:MAG: hypothetical protein V1659_04080 [Candidatus Woesearchaeota archaeon]
MGEERNGLFLVAIVAIVAVVGIIVLSTGHVVTTAKPADSSGFSDSSDLTGQASFLQWIKKAFNFTNQTNQTNRTNLMGRAYAKNISNTTIFIVQESWIIYDYADAIINFGDGYDPMSFGVLTYQLNSRNTTNATLYDSCVKNAGGRVIGMKEYFATNEYGQDYNYFIRYSSGVCRYGYDVQAVNQCKCKRSSTPQQ